MKHTHYNLQKMLQELTAELIEELDKRGGEIIIYKEDDETESNCEVYIGDGLSEEVIVNRIYRKEGCVSPFDFYLDCTIWRSGETLDINFTDAQINLCNLDWLLESIPEE